MSYRPWTAEEDAYLLQWYGQRTLGEIALAIGRSEYSVKWHVDQLVHAGTLSRSERYYQPPWSPEQEDYLADHWGLLPDAVIAQRLGRTVIACQIRAKRRLKLARQHQFYTLRTVADLFGVDAHLVARWIRTGVLRGRKSVVRCGDNRQMWRIDDKDLQAFVRRYPRHYDRKRIESGTWWRRLAEQVYAADPWLTATEAAARLGVNVNTVTKWVRQGKLPGASTRNAGLQGGYQLPAAAVAAFTPPRWGSTGMQLRRRMRRKAA